MTTTSHSKPAARRVKTYRAWIYRQNIPQGQRNAYTKEIEFSANFFHLDTYVGTYQQIWDRAKQLCPNPVIEFDPPLPID